MTDRIKQSPSGKIVGREVTFTLTYAGAPLADEGLEVQTATVPEVLTTDLVVVNPQAALLAGETIAFARVSAANSIDVGIGCYAAAGVTPGAIVFRCMIFSLAA
jgi:hypothetical protein